MMRGFLLGLFGLFGLFSSVIWAAIGLAAGSSTFGLLWPKQMTELGFARAQIDLGDVYDNGDGVAQSYEEAVRRYRLAAEQGDADAQSSLGFLYFVGGGVEHSYDEAVRWYRLAADQEHARAQFLLGASYALGRGVERSYEEAVRWYRLAADQGDEVAQLFLGDSYAFGEGVEQSDREAFRWYRRAAEQGNPNAQYQLGTSFSNGEGVAQSDKEAVRWYRLAADQGYPSAQIELANLGDVDMQLALSKRYRVGDQQLTQSDEAAVDWLTRAASGGAAEAQYLLGLAHLEGDGVSHSFRKAAEFIRQAAVQNYPDAVAKIDEIVSQHTSGIGLLEWKYSDSKNAYVMRNFEGDRLEIDCDLENPTPFRFVFRKYPSPDQTLVFNPDGSLYIEFESGDQFEFNSSDNGLKIQNDSSNFIYYDFFMDPSLFLNSDRFQIISDSFNFKDSDLRSEFNHLAGPA